MMRKFCSKLIISWFILFHAQVSYAVKVDGYVYDENNSPLPYCNIYVKGTTIGCASNELGYFSISIENIDNVLVFQYIGYKKKEIEVHPASDDIHLEVHLQLDIQELEEVVIQSGREDPAYEIIRNAISRREEHLNEIHSFSCEVYMKGLQKFIEAPDRILGIELKSILDVDSNNAGIIYLSESVSQFNFRFPDQTKEVMIASKVSGNDNQFSWNDARGMQMNFYNNLISLEGFSQRGFVSPVAANALFFYDYHLLGSFMDDGYFIYKIRVIPKRESDPVFSGVIYIRDGDFRIYSDELTTTKSQGLEFIDTFHVVQEYVKLPDNNWVMLSNKFNFNYSILGIRGMGYFNAFYKNYILNPEFDKNFFGPEISTVNEDSNKRDSIYWNDIRPVPLTTEEKIDYRQKDSLQIVKESKVYRDSLDRIFNKFSFGDIISGYKYRNTTKQLSVFTSSLPELLQYNTVEGWVLKPAVTITKTYESKNQFTIRPEVRYSITTDKVMMNASATYLYNNFSSAFVRIIGGVTPEQFNPNGIIPLVNTFYSLFLEENYLKIYQKTFIAAAHEREMFNGFTLHTEAEYARRDPLTNYNSLDPLVDIEAREFTGNNFPFFPSDSTVPLSDKFSFTVWARYVPGQLYLKTPGEKYILESKYPTLFIKYEKALPGIFKSNVQYDYCELEVRDIIKLNLQGNLEYEFRGGLFIQENHVEVPDEIHFAGNETIISNLQGAGFYLLPYYAASGTDPFFESHIQWHTEGFLFYKLPLFKQLKLQPVFSFNYLYNESMGNYTELAAGIEHLFRFARIDFAYTPYHFDSEYYAGKQKFKIVLGIGF